MAEGRGDKERRKGTKGEDSEIKKGKVEKKGSTTGMYGLGWSENGLSWQTTDSVR